MNTACRGQIQYKLLTLTLNVLEMYILCCRVILQGHAKVIRCFLHGRVEDILRGFLPIQVQYLTYPVEGKQLILYVYWTTLFSMGQESAKIHFFNVDYFYPFYVLQPVVDPGLSYGRGGGGARNIKYNVHRRW